MKTRQSRTCALSLTAVLVVAVLTAAPAGADAYRDLVQTGKEAFLSQCLKCHQSVDEAASGYRNRPSWQQIVTDMVAKGASLDEAQQKAVVEYLSGRMLLIAKCRSCHSAYRPLTASKSFEEWKSTVELMVQRMPPDLRPSAAQIDMLTVFLAVERPRR